MHRTIGIIPLLCLATHFMANPVWAQQVRVQATVNATTIGTEERVTLTLEVEGADYSEIRSPDPPTAENLILEYAVPNISRNVSIINGQMSQSVTFRWSFRAQREGRAVIHGMRIEVAGRSLSTESITIQVVPQSQRPQQPQTAQRAPGWPFSRANPPQQGRTPTIEDGDLFIRAVPSTRQSYLGQQIVIEYHLYGRDFIQLRQSRLTDSWDAEGFWREDLEVDTRPIPRAVVENGLRYNTIVLKRVAIFPTRAGALRVEPLQIETEVYVPGRASDPFSAFFPTTSFQPVKLSSPAVAIDVRPLPDGAPASFAGAVGDYTLDARLDATEVEVGESIQLSIALNGTGNIATVAPPRFEAPGIFEQYDPQITTDITRSGRAIRGRKVATHILVPRSNGTIDIPEIEFTYFDPSSASYRTLRADPGAVRVTGTAGTMAVGTTRSGLPVDDIAGLRTGSVEWKHIGHSPLHHRVLPYLVLLLPIAAMGGAFAYQRHLQHLAADPRAARSRRAHPLARKHLREAGELLARGESRAFYAEIERALLAFVGNRLDIPETGLTRSQLNARLAESGVPEVLRVELSGLLDEAERAQFAPVAPDRNAMETAIDRASGLIVAISNADKHGIPALG